VRVTVALAAIVLATSPQLIAQETPLAPPEKVLDLALPVEQRDAPLIEPLPGEPPNEALTLNRLYWHVPDPELNRAQALEQIDKAKKEGRSSEAAYIERILKRLDSIRRPHQVHLSLGEVIRRCLENSYSIETQRYNPAIEQTRLVEAESEFDAVFFGTIGRINNDQPTGSQLSANDVEQFTSAYGIRKLLASGMTVSGTWELNRTSTSIEFQQVNPQWVSTLNLELRQPLLRGFGIDFNRSAIYVARNNQSQSDWAFRRSVRDKLRNIEELYWRLVFARRDVTISSRLLADFEEIYSYLEARKEFDVIPVQLAATKASLEGEKATFVRRRATVFNAEQRLLTEINDPELPVAADIEIIPDDFPMLTRLTVDPLAEVQTALDERQEIKEQELRIANAKIAVGQAKNLELPRADVTFRYSVEGLDEKADRAFDIMTTSNFISYFVGVEFEIPIGNRGARALHQRTQLQYLQAESALRDLLEQVILDVHVSARELTTSYDQILPSFESAEARAREVDSIVARAERKDLNTLNSELGARQGLANERRTMLNAMVSYNIAIIDLERAKGTLLRYNNVAIAAEAGSQPSAQVTFP